MRVLMLCGCLCFAGAYALRVRREFLERRQKLLFLPLLILQPDADAQEGPFLPRQWEALSLRL